MITSAQFEASLPAAGPAAVAEVKARLQHDYEEAYPALGEIIHLVLDEEEAKATALSAPHLSLPDLVAAHIEKLNLAPVRIGNGVSAVPLNFRAANAALAQEAATSRMEPSTNAHQLRAA